MRMEEGGDSLPDGIQSFPDREPLGTEEIGNVPASPQLVETDIPVFHACQQCGQDILISLERIIPLIKGTGLLLLIRRRVANLLPRVQKRQMFHADPDDG